MSISSTRKVSSSTAPSRRADKIYTSGGQSESFVENIDTSNSVSVRDDEKNQHRESRQSFSEPQDENFHSEISSKTASVSSVIEALAMSGVYDARAEEGYDFKENSHKIGVYDNNQSIIREEEDVRRGKSYLKHFYEKNEIVEEVDEFV